MSEVQKRPPLERATWQRSVGAVLMRELFTEPFTQPYKLSDEQHEIVESLANQLHRDVDMGVPLLWAYAYTYIHEVLEDLRYIKININPGADIPESTNIAKELGFYTYAKWGLNDTIAEAMKSMGHFPLSLARSICLYAEESEVASTRYTPRSLHEIATILDSADFRLMIDQSLVSINGAWRGFSTSPLADLSTSVLMGRFDSYDITDNAMAYSSTALKRLREGMCTNNGSSKSDRERFMLINMTSSGCPARHLQPRFTEGMFDESIPELEDLFDTDIEELTEYRPESVVQLGISLSVEVLRQASARADEAIERQKRKMQSRIVEMGLEPSAKKQRAFIDRALYASYM